MSEGFEGKTAIVTGAAKGIGEAVSRALVAAGANVGMFDVDDVAGEATASSLDNVTYYSVDISDREAVNAAVADVAAKYGSVEMLVNNAGIAPPRTIDNMPEGEWERVLEINLTGAFNCVKAAAPLMKKNGGAIVNVSSVAGKNISLGAGMHYTASKWGLIGASRHMAYELAPNNIRVNIVCPGPTLTPLIDGHMNREKIVESTANVPLGRWVKSEDIANAILFFLGPQSAMCTGSELIVDGGVMIGSGSTYDNYFESRGDKTPDRNIELPEFS
jgi:3-oxoacyl-[acyl-carrier protein] reductase